MTVIVNKYYKIHVLGMRKNMTQTLNIRMNNFKTSKSMTNLQIKR